MTILNGFGITVNLLPPGLFLTTQPAQASLLNVWDKLTSSLLPCYQSCTVNGGQCIPKAGVYLCVYFSPCNAILNYLWYEWYFKIHFWSKCIMESHNTLEESCLRMSKQKDKGVKTPGILRFFFFCLFLPFVFSFDTKRTDQLQMFRNFCTIETYITFI
jgi:hypothetical protein